MSNISKEILRNYVNEQNFKNPNDVLAAMKEMFKDVLQEALEAEIDTQLGYDKYDVAEKQTTNSRNGYSKKSIKTELGP
ncbi:transposase, partial [Clostridium homopropionicum]